MKWVQWIVRTICPDFGGVVTFCEDPDELLDIPEVREAVRAEGVVINDWDGIPDSLQALQEIQDWEKPLLVVPSGSFRHVVDGVLSNYAWHHISLGSLFNKFSCEIVRAVPRKYWEKLKELHEITLKPQGADDTAILISRAIYGVDPLHLQIGSGWPKLLVEVSDSEEGIPKQISDVLLKYAPDWLEASQFPDLLIDPASARGAVANLFKSKPELFASSGSIFRKRIEEAVSEAQPVVRRRQQWKLNREISSEASAVDVLELASEYCENIYKPAINEDSWLRINSQFASWLEINYPLVLYSKNPKVLRVTNILDRIDGDVGDDKLLLLVVDALGLAQWNLVSANWQSKGVISHSTTLPAFAIVPTLTSLSRHALFQGKPPSQFTDPNHSQRLERKLWKQRFGERGAYYSSSEKLGILDSFAVGKRRICVVDVAWDKLAHSANPRFESVDDIAGRWSLVTELREVIQEGFKSKYRIMLTADHGLVSCRGVGRPRAGELTEERSKRVLLFNKHENRDALASISDCYNCFQPPGLPADCFPLFSRGLDSFDQEGIGSYSHGGLSIEEVIIPVAEIFC